MVEGGAKIYSGEGGREVQDGPVESRRKRNGGEEWRKMIHRDVVAHIAVKSEFQKRIREIVHGGSVPRSRKGYERAREIM